MKTILNLNWIDILKGAILLIITTISASLEPLLSAGNLPTWVILEPILQTTIAGLLMYLVTNIFTNALYVNRSSMGAVNLVDILKGMVIAVGGAFLSALAELFKNGWPTWTSFKPILITSVYFGITYVVKSLFTNSDNKFLKKESV